MTGTPPTYRLNESQVNVSLEGDSPARTVKVAIKLFTREGNMGIKLIEFAEKFRGDWERFLDSNPRNGDFMMRRGFLDYHGDKFIDRSIFFVENSEIISVFPAASLRTSPSIVTTHPGASYGGIAYKAKYGGTPLVEIASSIIQHYKSHGMHCLYIKTKPHIYSNPSGSEDLYAWWRLGANLERVDLSNIIEVGKFEFSTRRNRALRKLAASKIEVCEGIPFLSSAYKICQATLQSRHNTNPVHTLEDLNYLVNVLPDNIRITICYIDGMLASALILFVNQNAAIVQYWGSTDRGRELNALDPLVVDALEWCRREELSWFVPGVSTSESGMKVDNGIYEYKLSIGSGTISSPTLRVNLAD
jgi:hypothetical protein